MANKRQSIPEYLVNPGPTRIVVVESSFKKMDDVNAKSPGFLDFHMEHKSSFSELPEDAQHHGFLHNRHEASVDAYSGSVEKREEAVLVFKCKITLQLSYLVSKHPGQEELEAAKDFYTAHGIVAAQNVLRSLLMPTDFFNIPIHPFYNP